MEQRLYDIAADCPVIAAVKDDAGLLRCLDSDIQIIFVLYGDILKIGGIVGRIKERGKLAMVHMDLIAGLSGKEVAVDFIREQTRADGIISTKLPLIKRAKELKLYTVFRFFVIDSMAFENIRRQYEQVKPDFIEILPGLMPRIITQVARMTGAPLIAGGLIGEKADVIAAIEAGAMSISTTNQDVWFL